MSLLNGNVTFSSSTGMFWDNANSRLGIGIIAPISQFHISGEQGVEQAYIDRYGSSNPATAPVVILRRGRGNEEAD